jgi:hypothetical protein
VGRRCGLNDGGGGNGGGSDSGSDGGGSDGSGGEWGFMMLHPVGVWASAVPQVLPRCVPALTQ